MKTFPFSCFFALALVLASIFFVGKTEHEARPRDVFKLFYYQQIKVLVLSSQEVFPRWQRKKEVLRKGFQKRCDSCLLFMTMFVFIRYKEFPLVTALVLMSQVPKTRLYKLDKFLCYEHTGC